MSQNGGVKVKAPPQQQIYSTRGHQQDRNDFKHELSRTLTSYVSELILLKFGLGLGRNWSPMID